MIEDLLDLSRILSGKIRLSVESFDPAATVLSALESLRPAAEGKGIDLIPEVAQGLVFRGDEARIQQIAWNLVSNAIKFTPSGGKVWVILSQEDHHLKLIVKDNGIGIKDEFLPFLFDRFSQADPGVNRMHKGLGLGLSIVRHLAELHGGHVSALTEGEGRGSTFLVELPISQRPVSAAIPGREKSAFLEPDIIPAADFCSGSMIKGKVVLVVDDEADARELVRRILEECGAEVVAVESAQAAYSYLSEASADVIVGDIGMPQTDGFTMIRELRSRGFNVPAIALTAFARSQDREKALSAGYQAHITKPFDPATLVRTVGELATARQGQAEPTLVQ